MDDPGHLPDVEIHPDIQRFTWLLFLTGIIQHPVELMINGATGQVSKLAIQICLDQLRRVTRQERRNIVIRQVLFVVECRSLYQTKHRP